LRSLQEKSIKAKSVKVKRFCTRPVLAQGRAQRQNTVNIAPLALMWWMRRGYTLNKLPTTRNAPHEASLLASMSNMKQEGEKGI